MPALNSRFVSHLRFGFGAALDGTSPTSSCVCPMSTNVAPSRNRDWYGITA